MRRGIAQQTLAQKRVLDRCGTRTSFCGTSAHAATNPPPSGPAGSNADQIRRSGPRPRNRIAFGTRASCIGARRQAQWPVIGIATVWSEIDDVRRSLSDKSVLLRLPGSDPAIFKPDRRRRTVGCHHGMQPGSFQPKERGRSRLSTWARRL